MQVVTYTDPAVFLERTRDFLEREEAFNNLPLGILGRLGTPTADSPNPFLATVEEEGELVLVALMTPPRRLIPYSDRGAPQEALTALAGYLEESDWSVPGVLGPVATTRAFAEMWKERTGCVPQVHMDMRVYQLTAVEHCGSAAGRLRPVRAEDRERLVEWTRAFDIAVAVEIARPEDEVRGVVDRHIEQQTLFVWEDSEPVSMAGQARQTRHGIVVNAVYTPPEFRNQGYATACVAALSQRLLDEGREFCALFTDLANPTSNSIYQRIGYRPLGDYVDYAFE